VAAYYIFFYFFLFSLRACKAGRCPASAAQLRSRLKKRKKSKLPIFLFINKKTDSLFLCAALFF
jgi:hypothetical protein